MPQLRIPEASLKKHIAVLGTNGSGKTSVAKSQVVEPALVIGERVCSIDPTGVMWGVRLGANGKSKGGFKVYIVGGEHADFPLTKRDGELWAEIVGTSSDSFIFDCSLMKVTDRTIWFTDFAQTLIRTNKGPLRLVIDEAHLFAPQGGAKTGGLAPEMLHAANNLLALGRSKGLRVTMISQRPAKLHKDSLSQAHTLIAMKLIAPQDRAAIRDWVADQTDPENGKELISSLPSLRPGEGWIWAPAEGVLDRVQFPMPLTYDSSQAPEVGEGEAPILEPIDPAAIQGKLAEVAEEAKANDPALLRSALAEAQRKLAAAETRPTGPSATDLIAARVDGIKIGWDLGLQKGCAIGAEDEASRLGRVVLDFSAAFALESVGETSPARNGAMRVTAKYPDNLATLVGAKSETGLDLKMRETAAPTPAASPKPVAPPPAREPSPTVVPPSGTGLTGPQSKVLQALAWWNARGISNPTRDQTAVLSGWSTKSSNIRDRLSELTSKGLVSRLPGGRIALTADGEALAPEPGPTRNVAEAVRAILTGPQTLVFDVMLGSSAPWTRDDLAIAVGWSTLSSNIRDRLSELASLGIVERPEKGLVQLQEWVRR